ncbi:MAG: TonB family protein [Bacteroidota bacterium]|nr:TonB family protein [Bacteroidota bacterium]
MNTTIKSTNNMTEMLFEKRNKEYGAYAIRTTYNDSLIKSLLILGAILLLIVGSTLAYNNFFAEKPLALEKEIYFPDVVTEVDLTDHTQQKKVEPPKTHYKPATQAIATTFTDNPERQPDPNAKLGASTSPEVKGDTTDLITVIGDPKGGVLPEVKPIVEDKIEIVADVMPEFPGGTEALMHFLSNNIVYPDKAVALGVEGTVYVNFVINKEGKVDNIKILKGIGGDCNEEAMRVVAKMPKWKPGMNAGKEVKVMFNLPIRFRLQ